MVSAPSLRQSLSGRYGLKIDMNQDYFLFSTLSSMCGAVM